jgi:hypothetical protein
VALPLAQR